MLASHVNENDAGSAIDRGATLTLKIPLTLIAVMIKLIGVRTRLLGRFQL